MPWPNEQKERSRERILQSAFGLFAARGYDNITISDVMREAQKSHCKMSLPRKRESMRHFILWIPAYAGMTR